jgi:pyrroloquinoline quinone (PQQ) biosynthesis protein C
MDIKSFRSAVEAAFARQVDSLTGCDDFRALEEGRAAPAQYDAFIENVARSHLRSPQLLAFLYALSPPRAADDLRHNLLEELGLEEASGRAHPDLLEDLLAGAGLGHRLPVVQAEADEDLRRVVVEPLLHGTLREVGLAALTEIVAFEYMLARVSSRLARALATHRGVPAPALTWFTHHSEVDIRHAEQGLADLAAYVEYYEVDEQDALTVVSMALRDNVFARRYFRDVVAPAVPAGSAR